MRRYGLLAAFAGLTSAFQVAPVSLCSPGGSGERTITGVSEAEVARLVEEPGSYRGPCALLGPAAVLGRVTVQAFAQIEEDGTPYALGIRLPHEDFESLPSEPADGYRCLDINGDDDIDIATECVGGHERVLFLPRAWEETVDSPFRWALFNWNPVGHGPEQVWDIAHFDFHFFIQSLPDRSRIRIGSCAMLVDCDDLELGIQVVPPEHLPLGYEDRGVVEFGMGNHLIDPNTFGSPLGAPDHTLIYGAWAGRISFLEPMITLRFLERLRDGLEPPRCYSIPQPDAVTEPGFYPGQYCVRLWESRASFVVSLEDFRWRSTGVGAP